jgi:hypothetical protein
MCTNKYSTVCQDQVCYLVLQHAIARTRKCQINESIPPQAMPDQNHNLPTSGVHNQIVAKLTNSTKLTNHSGLPEILA